MSYNPYKTPSTTSPKSNDKGCLCPDNTYSTKCCDGSLQAQGIGNLTGGRLIANTVTHNTIAVTHNGILVTHT